MEFGIIEKDKYTIKCGCGNPGCKDTLSIREDGIIKIREEILMRISETEAKILMSAKDLYIELSSLYNMIITDERITRKNLQYARKLIENIEGK